MAEQIRYEFSEHLIEQQYAAEQAMLAELEAGNYTVENPLVKYNLYLVNPLSAVVAFKTEEEVAVTVTVLGKKPEGNFYHTFEKAKTHVLPIVGLYNDYETKVEIRPYRGTPAIITIKTPDVYGGVSPIHSMETTPEYLQDNVILVSPAGEDLASAFDYAGDARWHMNIACVFDVKRLKNGNLIMGTHRLIQMPYYMSGLYEISPCGKIYKEYRLPGGYHHDEFEMEDGNLLVLTDDLTTDTVEDMCVLIDRKTGEILKTWDYKNCLQQGLGKSGSWSAHDWFHNNAVWYDKNTNSLTFSGRHMDSMINIDFETGDLNWIIGDPTGWPEEWVKKYFFTPVGDGEFEWQYEQHACVITPDGDVMCFDNHHYGSKEREHFLPAKDSYSRGVRYRINTKDMTIQQVWQYGKERGAEFFSPYICNVEYYNEGHYMIHSGGIAYLNEEPSEALGAFAKQQGGRIESITVEVCDGKKELELQVPGNYYRGEKLKLYADGNNLSLGKGEILGHMGITKEFDTEIPMDSCGELLPDSCDASIIEEFDRFTFKSRFEKGQLVMLLLEGENETHRYFISTTAVPYLAMCCGTFLDSDERNTRTFINKAGLSGTFDVRVIVDDKKYETGVKITC